MQHQLNGCHFDYQLEGYTPPRPSHPNDLPSSVLFEWFAPTSTVAKARALQKHSGINRSVFGITQSHAEHSHDFEAYCYYPNANVKHSLGALQTFLGVDIPLPKGFANHYLTSFKINPDQADLELDVYDTLLACRAVHANFIKFAYNGYPVCTKCKTCIKASVALASSSTSSTSPSYPTSPGINHYKFFYKNVDSNDALDAYLSKITHLLWGKAYNIADMLPLWLIEQTQSSICISIKPNKVLGLYTSHVQLPTFVTFLERYSFPKDYISKIKASAHRFSHLLFDVGLNVTTTTSKTLQVTKAGFYGVF